MKKQKCKECGKEFEVKLNARYSRKYCDKCSAERKKAYENIHLIKIEDCEED
jgi:predicted nucleic acid-binding Zn ribbon protein